MKKVLYIILVLGFSLTIISCAEKEESTTTDTPAKTSSDSSSTMSTPSIADGTYKLTAVAQKVYYSNGTLNGSYTYQINHDSSVTPGYLAVVMEWKGSGVYRIRSKGKATLSASGLDNNTINCTTNGIDDVTLDTDGNVTNETVIQTGCGGSSSSITIVSQKFTPISGGFTHYAVLKDSDSNEYQVTYTFQKQSTSAVVTMASLTIGSQTYTNAFKSVANGCQETNLTDNSNGDKIYYLTTIVYYDNKSLIQSAPFFKDSSCTNKYTETSVLTNGGTFANPHPLSVMDNITVVQLSNYFDNGTAMPVFDNDSNAVDNGSMYGLIGNSDNVSRAGPLLMWGQIYPKSDNEVHASFGRWYACVFTGTDNCTSPDNFTRIQDNVAGSNTLQLEKYSVLK